MFLKELFLKNFRNHRDVHLDFHSQVVFLLGENGQGKTNLLEAISFFSTFKSFRSATENQILNWEASSFYLKALYNFSAKQNQIEYSFLKSITSKRKIKFNQELIKKRTDWIGNFLTVIFSPADLKIIEGGQSERRNFLDSFISSIDKNYLADFIEYNKILKHRNSILKTKNIKQSYLDFWNHKLIETGLKLKKKRQSIVEDLKSLFIEKIQILSSKEDIFTLSYLPNVEDRRVFEEKLKENLNRDLRLGYTTCGIHKDEIFIGMENRDLNSFASQGQKRSSILALKLSAYDYYKKTEKLEPILLIDDILNELDWRRRSIFLEMIFDVQQCFFTTTDLKDFESLKNSQKSLEIYKIQKNEITKEEL